MRAGKKGAILSLDSPIDLDQPSPPRLQLGHEHDRLLPAQLKVQGRVPCGVEAAMRQRKDKRQFQGVI